MQQDEFLADSDAPYDLTMPRYYSVASKGTNIMEPTVKDQWKLGENRDFDLMTFTKWVCS